MKGKWGTTEYSSDKCPSEGSSLITRNCVIDKYLFLGMLWVDFVSWHFF